MYDYTTTQKADAYQVVFSDKDKASAKKGIPTSSGGQTIRWDSFDDKYSVMVTKIGKHANEGDWVVTDATGKIAILSNEDFLKTYKGHAPQSPQAPAPVGETTSATATGAPVKASAAPVTTGAERQAARQKMATAH
jgi:hypothetical protein